ncbi:unnamed protein product [Ambrosiozyma monospora]|uniref:Unnamed protein product n=1 Tax=Ambrosiozyma monospora TaxID=43982 RepID=A0ACB5TVT6_AMBMO|nr:unnamed protein product [Ambrosiozyma monospora]
MERLKRNNLTDHIGACLINFVDISTLDGSPGHKGQGGKEGISVKIREETTLTVDHECSFWADSSVKSSVSDLSQSRVRFHLLLSIYRSSRRCLAHAI